MTPDVRIAFFGPWGLDSRLWLELGPGDIAGAVITTTLPGGYNTLDVQLTPQRVPKQLLLQQVYGHVVATVNGGEAFVGRLFKPPWTGKWADGFTAVGYYFGGLDEGPFSSADTTTVTTGALIQTVLSATDALVTPAAGPLWIDPQTPQVPATFSGSMPSEILNQVLTQGDALAQPTDALVWGDNQLRLIPRTPPAKPDYAIDQDNDALHREPDYEAARGGVSVDYTVVTLDGSGNEVRTPKTTARQNDLSFIARNRGVFRAARLHAGDLSDDAATAYRNAQLKLLARPTIPTTINLSEWYGLCSPEGATREPWLVRAGEWVLVEGDDSPTPIVSTRCDLLGGTLEVTLGDAPLDYHVMTRRLRETDAAARVGVRVTTGTRVG